MIAMPSAPGGLCHSCIEDRLRLAAGEIGWVQLWGGRKHVLISRNRAAARWDGFMPSVQEPPADLDLGLSDWKQNSPLENSPNAPEFAPPRCATTKSRGCSLPSSEQKQVIGCTARRQSKRSSLFSALNAWASP